MSKSIVWLFALFTRMSLHSQADKVGDERLDQNRIEARVPEHTRKSADRVQVMLGSFYGPSTTPA